MQADLTLKSLNFAFTVSVLRILLAGITTHQYILLSDVKEI